MSEQPRQLTKPSSLKILLTLVLKNAKNECSSGKFSCPDCPKQYAQDASLHRHRKYECNKPPAFKCPFCPKMSKQKSNINAHIRLKHPKELQNVWYGERRSNSRDEILDSSDPLVHKKRRNFCPFCKRLITNFSRHIVTWHKDETEVKEYIALFGESASQRRNKRSVITHQIRNRGNGIYNRQIVEGNRNAVYLPYKRSDKDKHEINHLTHVVCNYCLGLFKKNKFALHARKCKPHLRKNLSNPSK